MYVRVTVTQGDHLIKDSVLDDDDDDAFSFSWCQRTLLLSVHLLNTILFEAKTFLKREAIWVENKNAQHRIVMIGIPYKFDDRWCLTSPSLSSPKEYTHKQPLISFNGHYPNRAPSLAHLNGLSHPSVPPVTSKQPNIYRVCCSAALSPPDQQQQKTVEKENECWRGINCEYKKTGQLTSVAVFLFLFRRTNIRTLLCV